MQLKSLSVSAVTSSIFDLVKCIYILSGSDDWYLQPSLRAFVNQLSREFIICEKASPKFHVYIEYNVFSCKPVLLLGTLPSDCHVLWSYVV